MLNSIKKNFILQASYQLALIITPILTTPYLSRVLGAEQVGVYSYTYSITNYFVMFGVMGMATYGAREIAICGDDRARRSEVFCSAYACQLIICGTVLVVYTVYCISMPYGGVGLALIWGLWVLSSLIDVSWLMFGCEEFKLPTIRAIATRVAGVVIIFLFVRDESDLWIYVLSISGMYLLNQILLLPFIGRYVDYTRPSWKNIARHFLPNIRLFIPAIAISLYTSLDKIILGMLADMQQVGFFEYSEKLSRMPMAVITAMGTVMLPRMSSELARGNRKEAISLLGQSLWFMMAMAFALAFGIAAVAPVFAPVFLGAEFASCDTLMRILACIIPIISVTNVVGRQYLLPLNRDGEYTKSVIIGAGVNLAINVFLIPRFGALGSAIATVGAELAVLLVQVKLTHIELPYKRYVAQCLPLVLIGALMMALILVVDAYFRPILGASVTLLALEVISGAIVYTALFGLLLIVKRRFESLPESNG